VARRLTTLESDVILTFAKLQRISTLTKPSAVKAWLKREGISYCRDADGKPWTTLAAVNRTLAKAGDDGFTLNDPEGGLPEKRPVVSGRPQQVDRPDQGRRRSYSVATGDTGRPHNATARHSGGSAGRVFKPVRVSGQDEAGI
jgi:hypothetical protein